MVAVARRAPEKHSSHHTVPRREGVIWVGLGLGIQSIDSEEVSVVHSRNFNIFLVSLFHPTQQLCCLPKVCNVDFKSPIELDFPNLEYPRHFLALACSQIAFNIYGGRLGSSNFSYSEEQYLQKLEIVAQILNRSDPPGSQ